MNYKNTLPLLYGLQQLEQQGIIKLVKDYPSKIAQQLQDKSIDIGLIPVAAIKKIDNAQIIGNHCISSDGKVASVCLFSHVPVDEITHVYLDYQSNTSVQLVQILFKEFWKKKVEFLPAEENYLAHVKDTVAAVIIGDRAFEQLNHFQHIYDLSECWKNLTGQTFVFAAWVSTIPLTNTFIQIFDEYNAKGLQHIDEIVASNPYLHYDLKKYFTENISYSLNEEKRAVINLFLSKI